MGRRLPPMQGPTVATDFERFITCARCGDVNHETTDYPESLRYDGDETEFECDGCGVTLRVVLCVDYTYQTRAAAPTEDDA